LIKNLSRDDAKQLIQFQIIDITNKTLEKYKFTDFNKQGFLRDLKQIIGEVSW